MRRALVLVALVVPLPIACSGSGSPSPDAAVCADDEPGDGRARVLGVYTLPATALNQLDPGLSTSELSSALAAGATTVTAPGLGSGLDGTAACGGAFAMVTDSGPARDHDDPDGTTFPLPRLSPVVARVHRDGATLVLDSALPLVDAAGGPVSLLPNNGDDDLPFAAASSATPLPYDPDGIDPEDLRVLPGGDVLLVDEYRPSVIAVDGATGRVRARMIPAGESLPGAGYPVAATLPSVLAQRQRNAGFEGLALSADGHTAYAVLQAPLGEDGASRIVRILRLSIADPTTPGAAGGAITVTGDFVYRETAASAFPSGTAQRDVSISAAAWLGPDRLLLLERASGETKLVAVALPAAADIHGAAFENTLTPETTDLATLGVTPASGTPVFSSRELPALDGEKLEGLAILGRATVALGHDNDYGMDDARDATRIWIVRLGVNLDP